MNNLQYGYGHTAEASKLVRKTLKQELAEEIKLYDLKVRVLRSDSGYGGPRVAITTNNENFADYYEYIVDENGDIANSGTLVLTKSTDRTLQWHPSMQIKRARNCNEVAKAVHEKITGILNTFGRNNNDVMTDYFDNTNPLFYGVDYQA